MSSPTSSAPLAQVLEAAIAVAEGVETSLASPLVPDAIDPQSFDRRRVRSALDRVLVAPHPDLGLEALKDSGIFRTLMPEVDRMVGFGDGEWRHKDVWRHTKQVVCQATCDLPVRWAALLHDIGKPKTRSISPEGEVHFFGHAEVGSRMFDKLERRLGLFHDERSLFDSVRFLILHHLRASQYQADWTDSAVRRFHKEMGDELPRLLALSRADITTKRPEKRRAGLQVIDNLELRVQELAVQDAIVPPLPSGIGDALMAAFGIPPSRLIGDIKRGLEGEIERGELESHRDTEYYLSFVREHRSRFGLAS